MPARMNSDMCCPPDAKQIPGGLLKLSQTAVLLDGDRYSQQLALTSILNMQAFVLQLDLYKVHTSQDFRSWLYEKYPNCHLVLVPGGCTGLCQVADTVLNM